MRDDERHHDGRPRPSEREGAEAQHGPPGRHGRRGHGHPGGRGRGRASRGDVRAAVLLLLLEEPMHGYQLMQAAADRTDGAWRPSPGVVYPTIGSLEADGLAVVTREQGRKTVALTDAGRTAAEQLAESGDDPFAAFTQDGPDLRTELERLHGAVKEVGRHGTPEQQEAVRVLLDKARRDVYRMLADDAG
ncbi:PadR family transcriptional regulator [Nocardioides bruguierae]|uniref:PadR family transcriptional regulator n=1 Tax=Nocardioides bruguierae TaxID=2945102 RepID=A0A9X2D7P6_9ACTN|nr:PadR family transcriptional regulator [Nocardioides bruguierae]MCM0620880.1 PadR family transcriptional regulator [Nocardioides bruguierae]